MIRSIYLDFWILNGFHFLLCSKAYSPEILIFFRYNPLSSLLIYDFRISQYFLGKLLKKTTLGIIFTEYDEG